MGHEPTREAYRHTDAGLLVEWRESGWFKRRCSACGGPLEFEYALVDEGKRTRLVTPAPHDCEPLRAQRLARWWADFRDLKPETDRWIRRQSGLPGPVIRDGKVLRFHPGLECLERDADNEAAFQAAETMIADFQAGRRDVGLYLHGDVGNGKTEFASCLAFDLIRYTGVHRPEGWPEPAVSWGARATVEWWLVSELFEALYASFNREADPTETREFAAKRLSREAILKCDALFLDDLGNEHGTAFTAEMLFGWISQRYASGKALVITSNYSPSVYLARSLAFYQKLGLERLLRAFVDRINETCKIVELQGQSRRRAIE